MKELRRIQLTDEQASKYEKSLINFDYFAKIISKILTFTMMEVKEQQIEAWSHIYEKANVDRVKEEVKIDWVDKAIIVYEREIPLREDDKEDF